MNIARRDRDNHRTVDTFTMTKLPDGSYPSLVWWGQRNIRRKGTTLSSDSLCRPNTRKPNWRCTVQDCILPAAVTDEEKLACFRDNVSDLPAVIHIQTVIKIKCAVCYGNPIFRCTLDSRNGWWTEWGCADEAKENGRIEEGKTSSNKSITAKCVGQPTKNPKIRKSTYVGSSSKTKAATTTNGSISSCGPVSGHFGWLIGWMGPAKNPSPIMVATSN